jgi:hypothetical protein
VCDEYLIKGDLCAHTSNGGLAHQACFGAKKKDNINPNHYKGHPSGVECIQITEHMNFNCGNATKYIWRADLKHDDGGIEDLKKAHWYIAREIKRRGGEL